MTPTPSPDPGRCPECGCGWWEPHRTDISIAEAVKEIVRLRSEGIRVVAFTDALAYTVRWIDAQPPVPPSPAPQPAPAPTDGEP